MTREDAISILAVLKAAYPNFYRGMTPVDANAVIGLWAAMFVDEPVEVVSAAVKVFIASDKNGFPPHIGAVKEKIRLICEKKELDEAEAWNLVVKAVKKSGYKASEEFDKLPEGVKMIVGSPSRLRDWGMMDADTFNSVVASNFQRAYRTREKKQAEYKAIPSDVKMMIDAFSERIAIGGGEDGPSEK